MNTILAFYNSYRTLILAGAVVAAIGGYSAWVYHAGDKHGTQKLTDYIKAENLAKSKVLAKQEEVKVVIQEKIVTQIKYVKVKGDEITKEIPVLVHGPCIVSNGFVRVHTAAAENTVAGPPADTDGTASPYSEADVAKVDVANLTTLAMCRVKLDGWAEYYAGIKKLRD
jgi:hypothetical protein